MSIDSDATIEDLLRILPIELQNGIKAQVAQSYEEQVECVEAAIDHQVSLLTQGAHIWHNKSEDDLTVAIVLGLRNQGFNATHDTQIGGHCDIVIHGKNHFLWIAEAKIHSDYGWLEKGLQQLFTRYTTGDPGADRGEVIIYCKAQKAAKVLETWKEKIVQRHEDDIIISDIVDGQFFRTFHEHIRSGRKFVTRHKIVPLYFAPQD